MKKYRSNTHTGSKIFQVSAEPENKLTPCERIKHNLTLNIKKVYSPTPFRWVEVLCNRGL